jgi:hypothetical protein
MRRLVALACVGALLCAPVPALAQPAPAVPSAPAEPVTPAKLALVRRYLQAIHYERLVDQLLSAMLPVVAENLARQHPDLSSDKQKVIVDVVRGVMREKVTPQILERLAPIYAATFTEPELRAIVDFYESPAGQAVMAKAPALAPQGALILRSLLPEMQAEVARRLCEQLRCNAAPAAKPKAS